MLFVLTVNVKMEPPERVAALPATVLSQQDWIILFVVMVAVKMEPPERVAALPATVRFHRA